VPSPTSLFMANGKMNWPAKANFRKAPLGGRPAQHLARSSMGRPRHWTTAPMIWQPSRS
jgi:hypothetical protein